MNNDGSKTGARPPVWKYFLVSLCKFDGITHKYLHCCQHAELKIFIFLLCSHYKNIEYVWKGFKTFSDPNNSTAPGHPPTPGFVFWNSWIRHFWMFCFCKASYNYEGGIAEIYNWQFLCSGYFILTLILLTFECWQCKCWFMYETYLLLMLINSMKRQQRYNKDKGNVCTYIISYLCIEKKIKVHHASPYSRGRCF